MWRLLKSELFRLQKRPMARVLTLLLVVIVVTMYVLLWIASGRVTSGGFLVVRRALFLRETVPFGLQIIWFFWGLLAVVLASGVTGSEYGWGTIRTLLMCSRSRLAFFVAKLLAILAFTVTGALLGLAAAIVTSTIITLRSGGADFSFVTADYMRDAATTFLRTIFTILPYLALAVFFSTLGRSTLAGVAAALGWRFLEGLIATLLTLAGGRWAEIPDYLLRSNVASIQFSAPLTRNLTRALGADDDAFTNLPSVEHAVIVLLAYIAVLVLASAVVFQRRDFTA